eukprot:CFRG1548T1
MGGRASKHSYERQCSICSDARSKKDIKDWKNLPPELLMKICGHLKQKHINHFRGVCRSFNAAARNQRFEWHLRPARASHDECLKFLVRAYPNIRILSLRGCHRLTDYGMQKALSLRTIRNLSSIDMFNCIHITDETIIHLVKTFPMLRRLKLSNCNLITAKGIAAIGTLQSLVHIDVALMVALKDEHLWELGANGCPSLVELDISGCRLVTNSGVSMLLMGCTSINKLRAVKCPKLTRALEKQFSAVEMDLSP